MKRPSWKVIVPTLLVLVSIVCLLTIIAFSKAEEVKHYEKGKIYANLNRHSEAIKEFEKALEKKPNFLDAVYRLGRSYCAKKDYEKALEAYGRCIDLKPDFLDARYQIGLLYLEKGNIDKVQEVSDALRLGGGDSEQGGRGAGGQGSKEAGEQGGKGAEGQGGRGAGEQGSGGEKGHRGIGPSLGLDLSGRIHLEKLRALVDASTDLLKKESPGPETRAASRELARGDLAKAIEHVKKLDKIEPGRYTKELFQHLTEAVKEREQAANDFERALESTVPATEEHGKAQKSTTLISTRLEFANIRLNQGKIDDVKEHCNKILDELDPGNRTARMYLSLACAQEKDYESAISGLQEILSKNPQDPQAHLVLTELYFQTGKYDEALEEAKSVPGEYAKNPYLYYIKGLAYLSKKDYEQAIVELTASTTANPDFHEAHFHLARALLAAKRDTQAIRELQTTIRLQPDFIGAHLALADIHLRNEWFEEAASQARRVLEVDEKNVIALRILSESLRRQGKYAEAGSYLENIIDSSLALDTTSALPAPGQSRQAGQSDLRDHLSFMDVKLAAGEGDSVIARYESAVKANPQDLVWHNLLGVAYLKKGEVGKAVNQFREMVKIDPGHVGARIGLARAYAVLGRRDLAIEQYQKALETDPESAALHLGLGALYQARKKPENALAELTLVVKNDPRNAQAMLAMATIYANMGKDDPSKYDEAIKLARDAQVVDPNAIVPSILLAAIYRAKGDSKSAAEELERALQINPRFRPAYEVGLIYCSQGELDKAIRIYKKAIDASPRFADAYFNLAVIYQQKETYKKAEEYCNQAIKLLPAPRTAQQAGGPKNQHLRIGMANILMGQGKFDQARGIIEKIEDYRPEYKNAYLSILKSYGESKEDTYKKVGKLFNQGIIYLRGRWFKNAESCYKAILTIDPENLIALSSLGDVYFLTGRQDEAISMYEKVIDLSANFTIAYRNLGVLYNRGKKTDEAIAFYKRAIKTDPNFWQAHLELGDIYINSGMSEDAANQYETVISLFDRSVIAYNNLAWLLAEGKKDLVRAMSLAERAKALASANGGVLDTLGYIYYLGGKDDKAVAELETAVLITPNEPTIRYHLGAAYERKGSKEKALKEYKVALEISSKFPEAEEAKKAIARLDLGRGAGEQGGRGAGE